MLDILGCDAIIDIARPMAQTVNDRVSACFLLIDAIVFYYDLLKPHQVQ